MSTTNRPGRDRRIEVPVSPAPYTQKLRAARHVFFGVNANLEMFQQVQVVYVDEHGIPVHELIDQDESLSPEQRRTARAQYPTSEVTKTTEGAWCDPATGVVVSEGLPGAVPQLAFFQAISVEQMLAMTGKTAKSSFAEVLYAMLGGEIRKIDARGGL